MAIGIKLPKNKKESITDKVKVYNNPKFVYIPLVSQNDTNITIMVKKGDYVFKGQVVGKRKGNLRIPIHASVSGTVVDFAEKTYLNGSKVKCVVIENDNKEQIESKPIIKKRIDEYTKEEFVEIIKEAGIVGLGGAGFPTYVKYESNKRVKVLLINAIECEPFITADYMLVKERCEEILEAINAVLEINGIPEAIIAIKKDNTDLRDIIMNFIGTYPKVKLQYAKSIYPMGWERALIKEVLHENYGKLPIEKGIIVNNISTMYAIYEALKYSKPLIERIITISGDIIKEPQNILVKVGTKVSEIIEVIGGYKRFKDVKLIAGGPMMGVTVKEDLVVSANLNCVLVFKDEGIELAEECLRCGKCVENCPARLSPVLIKDSLKSIDRLKELEPNRCIECGLCSYVCPAKINVREAVKKAKSNLLKGDE